MPNSSTRHRWRAPLAVLATAAGLLAALPAGAASAAAPAAAPAVPDALSAARAQAVATGQAVPVPDLTTEISTVQANADGTFTATTDLLPVRVRKNGSWQPVDADLAANADGTFSPKATPNSVALSGGGPGPLVTLTHADGTSMALTMPFALPAPAVSGPTALYAGVLPGVDLSVSVTGQGGFSDVLIVHDAAAAADPRLARLTLAAATDGLALHPNSGGGVDAVTADGTLAYTSPRPLMWDSATAPAPFAAASLAVGPEAAAAGLSAAGASADAPASSAAGPGSAARVESVPMTTTAAGLTLTPDPQVLGDPATRYPLFIDPYTNPVSGTAGHFDELYSSSACSNSPQYDKPQTNGEGVGYQQYGGACGNGLERSYYVVNTGNIHTGFDVYDARVTVATTYAASWDCGANQPLTLHTTNAIGSGTDWDSRPGTHDTAFPPVSTTVPSGANPSSSCSNHTATFVVTNQVQTLADHDGDGYDAAGTLGGGDNTWTFGLYGNESQTSGNTDFLRMSQSLTLTTKFDVAPATPTSPHIVPAATGASGPCVMTGDGWIGSTTYSGAGSNIQLHSTVTSQISGEKVTAHYHVWDRTVLDSAGNALDKSTPASAALASGTDASVPAGFKLLDGHEYGWDVYAQDNSTLALKSPISGHCWFKADFAAPDTPVVAPNPSFPPVGTGAADPVVYAAAGRTTGFTVTGADADATDTSCTPGPCLSSGIDHFVWKLDSAPTAASGTPAALSSTAADGTGTATITGVPVTSWGVHTLYVAGVDAAGNLSTAPAGYTYTVPWNPDTKITPGDITGDGVPDLLATTKTGDLDLIPGDTDPAQSAAPAQTGPVTGTPPAVTGPVTVATAADSPDHTGWDTYLVAHRGNLHGGDVDDLFAYHKTDGQMYVVKNDLDPTADDAFPLVPYSTFGGFVGRRFDVIPKDPCQPADVVPDDTRCRATDYDPTNWKVTQLVAPGNVFGNSSGYPAVVTVENKELWIYQAATGGRLKNPVLLGDGDWSGQTLIAPGTFQGSPVLWSRDNATGALYSYPLTVDQATGLPGLLHPAVHATLPLTLPPAAYPVVASPGDINSPVNVSSPTGGPDGNPDLYAVDTDGQLVEYPYVQSGAMVSPPQYVFAAPASLGTVSDTATHAWSLAEGSGTSAADARGALTATVSGAAAWATDSSRGPVLGLSGTTGYAATAGPAVDNSRSFTVSAWVKLDSLAANSTFVSQSDTAGLANGLQLYYSSGKQQWAFGRHNDDTTSTSFTSVYGTHAAVGKWTHLVGVYDAGAKTLTLYVNGSSVGTRTFAGTTWNAAGPLQIGRRLYQGAYGEYADGQVSDVRLYQSALPLADAASGGDAPAVIQLG